MADDEGDGFRVTFSEGCDHDALTTLLHGFKDYVLDVTYRDHEQSDVTATVVLEEVVKPWGLQVAPWSLELEGTVPGSHQVLDVSDIIRIHID